MGIEKLFEVTKQGNNLPDFEGTGFSVVDARYGISPSENDTLARIS
jgi:hypothetical protein